MNRFTVTESVGILTSEARKEGAAGASDALAGAPPCITAPANSKTRILRKGVDSLYLTYKGKLSPDRQEQLRKLKELAQSDHEPFSAGAQLTLGEHLFEVKAHGRRRFPIVLADNWFDIGVSVANSDSFPLANIQISSELISAQGVEVCTQHLSQVMHRLASIEDNPKVSRLDLFMDFVCDLDFEAIPRQHFVKRAKKRATYEENDQATGWMFGQGGDISARLYNKTVEIQHSNKDYLRKLWTEAGWKEDETVWRLEFQLRREVLQQFSIGEVSEMLLLSAALWNALMTDWLRLAIPSADDSTRSRWPTHPVWLMLTEGFGMDVPSLERVIKQRIPGDKTLFKNGLWAITSFMARENITEFDEGLAAYLRHIDRFFERDKGSQKLERYINDKVLAKGKRYNTMNNTGEVQDKPEGEEPSC